MVNKVAVIAIVAILAVPILIGFGMNLEPTSKTEYLPDNESVIVSQLLQNGTAYSFVHADSYNLNTGFQTSFNTLSMPLYEKVTTAHTSFKSNLKVKEAPSVLGGSSFIKEYSFYYVEADYQQSVGSLTGNFYMYSNGTYSSLTIPKFHSLYYDYETNLCIISSYIDDESITHAAYADFHSVASYSVVGGYDGIMYCYYDHPSESYYIDISAGYRFYTGADFQQNIGLPNMTKTAIMTVNLDSAPASAYQMNISVPGGSNFTLQKRVIDGQVTWKARHMSNEIPLYYNSTRSDNTYQIVMSMKETSRSDTRIYYTMDYELRYVGGWPTVIGEANYYQKYNMTFDLSRSISSTDLYLTGIKVGYTNAPQYPTLVMRMDDALYAGVSRPAIQDNTLDPVSFKSNPATTMKNINYFGSAVEFGGNSYNVDSAGNITLGTHKTSLNGIVFDSVPVTGGYDNRINGITISTTSNPSTIKFVGTWVANVSVDSQSVNTYNTTVWHAGDFAWDGMDQNFLIIGLITSLGVFIGLGIYARKSNSKGVIPLMIVCGGAAVLFFVML